MDAGIRKLLEKQHYEFAGENTGVKICEWTKRSLRDEDFCYKQQFYGIRSHLCCQMSPTVNLCTHSCIFCWRPIEYNQYKPGMKIKEHDSPKDIIENCINAQKRKLSGFGGNKKVNKKKLAEAENPKHFAISLSGEPTFYPRLPKLIRELHSRNITSFLVTNGTNPAMLKKLIKNQPTQLYITLPAPDKKIYIKTCNPYEKKSWNKIMQSLKLVSKFKRGTIRLTLVKGINMLEPHKYAELIENSKPKFVECKAYMCVGFSRQRLKLENMPRHHEIVEFAKEISKNSSYKIIDEKPESRVVLLMKKDFKGRKLKF